MIAIIDYNMGNPGSIKNMLARIGSDATISSDSNDILNATKLILPGVGKFDAAMQNLQSQQLIPLLHQKVIDEKTPILGICLGMQLFTKSSEEGTLPGLGWIDAHTVRFCPGENEATRIPHMGWNHVDVEQSSPILNDRFDESRFYFVHSYHVQCERPENVLATTNYGIRFHSAIIHENILGTQFHPEKSHKYGLRLLRNFCRGVVMQSVRVIPCLLLKGTGLVKTRRFHDPTYIGDPQNAVKIFNDKEVDELILLDIDATPQQKSPNFDLVHDVVSEAFMPVAYGGGIRTVDDARTMLFLGVEKIVISTAAVENPRLVCDLVETFGSQSIVVCLNVVKTLLGKYVVVTHGAKTRTRLDPVEFAKQVEELGAGEVMVNSVDCDGMMSGYDVGLMRSVSDSVRVPTIACGGAGSVQHFSDAYTAGGVSAVAAGSMFVFHGKHRAVLISYPKRTILAEAFAK